MNDYIPQQGVQMGTLRSFNDGQGAHLRLRCLELASGHGDTANAVKLAGEYYDFITGKTTAERVTDAIAKADI